jgi:hypothetical protein
MCPPACNKWTYIGESNCSVTWSSFLKLWTVEGRNKFSLPLFPCRPWLSQGCSVCVKMNCPVLTNNIASLDISHQSFHGWNLLWHFPSCKRKDHFENPRALSECESTMLSSEHSNYIRSCGIAQSVSDGLRTVRPGFDSRQGKEIFLFSHASRSALGSTQPYIKWVPQALYSGVKRVGVKLTTELHPVLR